MNESISTDQIFISKLTEIVLANLGNENFGVKELIRRSGMSRIGLSRKLHGIASKTINQFIREIRLQKALELLQNGSVTASEVAYKVGFSSPAYFNTCFHEYFGYPPGKVKRMDQDITQESLQKPGMVQQNFHRPAKRTLKIILALISFVSVAAVALFIYPEIIKPGWLDTLFSSDDRISVAVMPFQIMTGDSTWNTKRIWIQDELIAYLSNFTEELKVRHLEMINNIIQSNNITDFASVTVPVARRVSEQLDADVFIYGNIKQAENIIRLNSQFFEPKTGEAFSPVELTGTAGEDNIFQLVDKLKMVVADHLRLSKLNQENPLYRKYITTTSPEAYRFYLYGQKAFAKLDYSSAIDLFSEAISLDSNFFDAAEQIAWAYGNQGLYDKAKEWCMRSYSKREVMPLQHRTSINWAHARFFETYFDEIKYLKQLREIDDQSPDTYYLLGNIYNRLYQYEKAIPELERSLEIYNELGPKPWWVADYTSLGLAYHKTGRYRKEGKLYKKAEQDFPDDPFLLYRQAILALSQGDTAETDGFLRKYISVRKAAGASPAAINTSIASIYAESELPEKAEEYYRQALYLEPENAGRQRNLAYFLIDRARNVNEGLELIEKALQTDPDNYSYLDCKGWGLHKQGKYSEALELLEKSWRTKPVYNYDIYIHLEEVKKAVAGRI